MTKKTLSHNDIFRELFDLRYSANESGFSAYRDEIKSTLTTRAFRRYYYGDVVPSEKQLHTLYQVVKRKKVNYYEWYDYFYLPAVNKGTLIL